VDGLPSANIAGIVEQDSRLAVVAEIGIKNFVANPVAQHLVAERHEHFDALVEITGHPVSAAHVDLFLAAVGEVIDPAVFEKTSHNTAHSDVLAHTSNAGT